MEGGGGGRYTSHVGNTVTHAWWGLCGAAWLGLALGCAPAPKAVDEGAPAPVLYPATVDEAHVVAVVELGAGTNCSLYVWCGATEPFERIEVTALDPWVGTFNVSRLLVPHATMEVLDRYFGPRSQAILAGRVEGPDDPAVYGSTCGMEVFESFTWPVDADALWVLDQDGQTVWHLQCVLAVAESITGGTDPSGRTFKEALGARQGCSGTKAQAFREAQQSAQRVANRPAQVTGENRCRRRDIMDGGA